MALVSYRRPRPPGVAVGGRLPLTSDWTRPAIGSACYSSRRKWWPADSVATAPTGVVAIRSGSGNFAVGAETNATRPAGCKHHLPADQHGRTGP